ncbi:hypothetical protein RHOSPDRAFT_28732 [Rhodotorula sp. JG-1b]|nr:hypothetical protein RHOSPDRAFT_28732 [Rhodotorula sp. JG-1b]
MSSLAQIGAKHVAKGVGRYTEMVMTEGRGSYIKTECGRTILDLTCGIGVTNLGHCHPGVTKAAQEQVGTLVHGQVNLGYNKPYLQLIEHLLPVMPHKSLDSFFLWNSGAEAVEASVKLARHATGKQNIIVVQGSYHGRTFGTMALTKSKTIYGAGYAPLMPGVFTTPYPYWHQMGLPHTTSNDELVENALYRLELLLKQETAPRDTAAIIIEPVLGEGGYIPAPKGYLEGLRRICDENNMLLIADEVQTGFGRTGKNFAIEHYPSVVPDVMVFAKGVANGFPLSGIVSRKELMDKQPAGSQGGTYGGNAVACAAGVAVQRAFKEEKVLENVAARSDELFGMLRELQADAKIGDTIAEVRGLGLMVGVEFKSPTDPYTPAQGKVPAKMASRVQNKCLEKDLLTLTTSVYETMRFIPPLNISKEDMAKACQIIKEAISEVVHEG